MPDQVLQSFMKLDTILVDLNNGVDVCGVGYNTDQSLSREEEFDKYTDRIMEKSKQLAKGLNYCQNYEPSTELSTGTRLVDNNNIETITYLHNGLSNSLLLSEDSNFNQNDKDYVYSNERLKANDRYYVSKLNRTVSKVLDAKGQITNSYEYNDYGSEIKDTKARGFLYNGEYVDNNKLQYLRARYYESSSKQFIQKDTYNGELNQINSQNQYSYALNNPYKYVDDSGNKASNTLTAITMVTNAMKAVAPRSRKTASKSIKTGVGSKIGGSVFTNAISTVTTGYNKVLSNKGVQASINKAKMASATQTLANVIKDKAKKAAANLSKTTKTKKQDCNIKGNNVDYVSSFVESTFNSFSDWYAKSGGYTKPVSVTKVKTLGNLISAAGFLMTVKDDVESGKTVSQGVGHGIFNSTAASTGFAVGSLGGPLLGVLFSLGFSVGAQYIWPYLYPILAHDEYGSNGLFGANHYVNKYGGSYYK